MITVTKRSGEKVPYHQEKIQRQIALACKGIPDVSPSMIEINAQLEVYDGMPTSVIDRTLLKAMVNLIDESANPDINHVNYQYVAGRQRLSMLRKEVYKQYAPPSLYEIVKNNVAACAYTDELLTWYTKDDWDRMETFVDHDKDEEYTYAAIEQLVDKYLVRNRVTGVTYETPQVRYIVAAATAFHAETGKDRMRYVKQFYQAASDGLFTLATPVLAGLGTTTKQFSSCVLLRSDDTLDSIFATGEMMAKYASKRAGIGLEVGRLRPGGAPIRNGEIKHTGMLPFLKKWFGDLRSCSQGGIRNASATVTYPIWHYQVEDLIVLKNNQGTEETRVRHMDYSVVMCAYFWRRFKNQQQITLFDPNEVPDLYEAYYTDMNLFERLYETYENDPKVLRKKQIAADDLIRMGLIKERTDTGRIYIINIDNVMNQGPFDSNHHPIYQSNLCVEIILPTVPFQRLDDPNGRIALCTLGSINWGAHRQPEDMRTSCKLLTRALSNLLAYQDFLSIHSKLSNEELEPLGIGVTNLAYWHAKRSLKYGDQDALDEVKRWMEHQAYYLTEATVELAKERGACKHSHLTWYGRGVFPWERRAAGVNELADFTPELDWEALRPIMVQYGVRNATLMAIAPVESSSVVINSTNGIEMPMELISVKESKSSSLIQVVPEYHKLKKKYSLLWNQTNCDGYLKTAAVLAAYVDQSISTNTFYSPNHFPNQRVPATLVAQNLMLAHKWGLKTLYYSLINKQGSKVALQEATAIQTTDAAAGEDDDDCLACKL